MLNWLRRTNRPNTTGKVIDMTKTMWGHNLSITKYPDDKGRWEAAIWNATGAAVGDELTWLHDSGTVRSVLTAVRSAPSVWDMYFVEGIITHLNDERIN